MIIKHRWCDKGIPLKRLDQYQDSVGSLDTQLVMDGHRVSLMR